MADNDKAQDQAQEAQHRVGAPMAEKAINRQVNGRRLTNAQKLFITKYTDPKAEDTYLNATQSYQTAHPAAASSTAQVEGSRTLRNPMVISEIERYLNAQGGSEQDIARALGDIIQGRAQSESVTYDRSGNVISRTVSSPRHTDRIKASELNLKARGHFVKQQVAADVAVKREHDRLVRKACFPPRGSGGGGEGSPEGRDISQA